MSDEKQNQEEKPDSSANKVEASKAEEKKKEPPIKLWTGAAVALCIAIFAGHLLADKYTPYTSNGRIEAFVVPIVPQVSGALTQVNVTNNQFVTNDQVLAVVDSAKYELAVRRSQADLRDRKSVV